MCLQPFHDVQGSLKHHLYFWNRDHSDTSVAQIKQNVKLYQMHKMDLFNIQFRDESKYRIEIPRKRRATKPSSTPNLKKNGLAFSLKSSQHCIQLKQMQYFTEQTKYECCAHLLSFLWYCLHLIPITSLFAAEKQFGC